MFALTEDDLKKIHTFINTQLIVKKTSHSA